MKQTEELLTTTPPVRLSIALGSAVLLGALGTSIANIALPAMTASFEAPLEAVKNVVVSYLAALTLMGLAAGRLGDRYGSKTVLVIGFAVFATGSLAALSAPGLGWLVAARFVQGAGAAVVMTLPMALIRETTPKDRMGRAMGLMGTLSALGTALGPVIGGALVPLGGWRAIFALLFALSLPGLLLVTRLPKAQGGASGGPTSLSAVLSCGLVAKLIVNGLVAIVMMATLVVGPYALESGLGLRLGIVGLVMAVGPILSMVSGIVSGRLVDRFGTRIVLLTGLVLLACGAALLAMLPIALGVSGYVLALVVLTPGYQMFLAANNTEALAARSSAESGTVAGLLSLSRNLGLMAGASLMATIFARASGAVDLHAASHLQVLEAMRTTFLIAAALALTGLAITVLSASHPPKTV
ncbi:MFS transporter [Rhizobium sp. SG2393]|uniref:MFS transporter n=1 Tax=Rhizobium sp. SG2393 TaxID=3276279 RepID=UPI00366F2460